MRPGEVWSLFPADKRKQPPSLCQGRFTLDIRKREGAVKHWNHVQGSGGVTTPGKVQEICGCGTWGCGLVLNVVVLG